MKTLLAILLVCILNSASAKTYYFSAVSGDDSRTSTEAQNSSTPWKTLSKLNSFFSSLLPGDVISFKRGETFYGSITVNKSGTATAPIIINGYGTGSRPVITSMVTLSGWKANSTYSGVYESDANAEFDAAVNIVLLNSVQAPIGRYPNTDLPNKGYLTVESGASNTSISDSKLPASPNWTGGDIVIRTSRWTLDKGLITSHSGTKISYKASATYSGKAGHGYFIQNHIKTLDQMGEWYYNPSTKKISMYFGSNNPSSYFVQAATNENLVYSSGKSYVGFEDITFKGANGNGLHINSGTNNYVSNCDILFSGIDGVRASGINFKIENSSILNSNNNGIHVGSGTASIVRNNIIKNSYTIAGMGQSGNGQGAGVRNSSKGLVEYNQILNSGYVGVQLGGDYAIVKNNYIDSFCFVKDDGAAIYTSNGENITNKGRKIMGNIILNAIGAGAGTHSPLSVSAEGIYMDDNSNGVEITGNTVANCNRGIYLHNSRDIILKENTFYNHDNGQLNMKYDGLGDPLRNHTITKNIFFSKLITQNISSISTKANDIASIGRLDSNYYVRPIDDKVGIHNCTYLSSSGQLTNYHDLEGWKTKYGHDKGSKISAKKIAPYKINSLIGLNKLSNGTFNSSAGGHPNSCVISWGNAGLMDGGYLKVVPSGAGSSIILGIGALTAGKNYLLKYSVKGAGNVSLSTYLRSASYAPNTVSIKRSVSTSRTENEILFSPITNETVGALVFTADVQTAYYLDNIQLYEATATPTNPDDSIKFVYNASNVNKTVSLNGSYVDVKNNKFSNNIILQPYASAILIKDGEAVSTPANESPTVNITSPINNASFAATVPVIVSATAADSDGSVTKVDFYNGTTLLGSDSTSPYTFTWNNIATGYYSLTAKATDNGSLATTSSSANISVYTPNEAPTVTITSPVNNLTFASPASITISADADDADGSISKVEFYNNSTLLGSDTTTPYTFTWDNVPTGNYSLTAKGYDNSGISTISLVIPGVVLVDSGTASNLAPTVSITNPITNISYSGPATINMRAEAKDADGKISKVEFYNGTTLLVTEKFYPYTYTWTNVPIGNYTITAKAYDNFGLVTTSADVLISVANNLLIPTLYAPTVSITNPVNKAKYTAPATISMSAIANDADGKISRVEFYNGSTLLKIEYAGPYLCTWGNIPTGVYSLTAKAYDNKGNMTTSSVVSISVTNSTPVIGNAVSNPISAIVNSNLALAPKVQNTGSYREPVNIKVGPNPASKTLSVFTNGLQRDKELMISVLSVSGVLQKSITTTTSNRVVQVDISSLINGVYFIKVMSGDVVVVKQFVKR